MKWKPPKEDGGSPLTGYVIEKQDVKYGSWSKVGKVEPTVTEFCAIDLQEKSNYLFRVMAVNKAGQSEPLEMDKPVTAKSPFGMNIISYIFPPKFHYYYPLLTSSILGKS